MEPALIPYTNCFKESVVLARLAPANNYNINATCIDAILNYLKNLLFHPDFHYGILRIYNTPCIDAI